MHLQSGLGLGIWGLHPTYGLLWGLASPAAELLTVLLPATLIQIPYWLSDTFVWTANILPLSAIQNYIESNVM